MVVKAETSHRGFNTRYAVTNSGFTAAAIARVATWRTASRSSSGSSRIAPAAVSEYRLLLAGLAYLLL